MMTILEWINSVQGVITILGSILGGIITLIGTIIGGILWLQRKFAAIDARFEAIDARFAAIDARFEAVDARFEIIERKLATIDARLAAIDERFATIDARLAAIDERFATIDARLAAIDERFATIDARLAAIDERFATIDARLAKVDARFATTDEKFEKLVNAMRIMAENISENTRVLKMVDENIITVLARAHLILPEEQITLYKSFSDSHINTFENTVKWLTGKANPFSKEEVARLVKYKDMATGGKIFSLEEAKDFHELAHKLDREPGAPGEGVGFLLALTAYIFGVSLGIEDDKKKEVRDKN
ncbi:MAG: hypothetical protein AB1422_02955 [bacterium]